MHDEAGSEARLIMIWYFVNNESVFLQMNKMFLIKIISTSIEQIFWIKLWGEWIKPIVTYANILHQKFLIRYSSYDYFKTGRTSRTNLKQNTRYKKVWIGISVV